MRLLSLVFTLAIISWLVYTYMGSNTVIKANGDKTVKEQVIETIDEAKEATKAMQKSLDEQTKRMQKFEK